MAEFDSHLKSYDSQLQDVTKTAGDATLDVTKIGERVGLFERNLTSLRTDLEAVRRDHTDTDSNLELLSLVSPHSTPCLSPYHSMPPASMASSIIILWRNVVLLLPVS